MQWKQLHSVLIASDYPSLSVKKCKEVHRCHCVCSKRQDIHQRKQKLICMKKEKHFGLWQSINARVIFTFISKVLWHTASPFTLSLGISIHFDHQLPNNEPLLLHYEFIAGLLPNWDSTFQANALCLKIFPLSWM